MNKILTENIETQQKVALDKLALCATAQVLLSPIEFTDSIDFNFYGDCLWIVAKDRTDVEKVLALAPAGKLWTKKSDGTHGPSICYQCEVMPGVRVMLFAVGDALPPTCKLVEEEVTIPAQPERKEMRRVLKCAGTTKPEEVAPSEEVVDGPTAGQCDEILGKAHYSAEPTI